LRDSRIEVLAEGYEWSEGPIWVKDGAYLLFSDVPKNVVHRVEVGEEPAVPDALGYTSKEARPRDRLQRADARQGRPPGARQHGDRASPHGRAFVGAEALRHLADRFEASAHSPNDLVFKSNGISTSRSAYGMEKKQWTTPGARCDAGCSVDHLTHRHAADEDMTPERPGLLTGRAVLDVAQSDQKSAIWGCST
jgi:gluconolactonase